MVFSELTYEYEPYELQMVLWNQIPGLLPMQKILEGEADTYWYEVTGCQSLNKHPKLNKIGYSDLELLMHGVCDLKQHLEAYFLDDHSIHYAPESIYYDRLDKRFLFCYVPGLASEHEAGMEGLMEYILQHLDHGDEKAVRVAYELYEHTMQCGFSLEACKRALHQSSTAAM